LDPKKKAPAKKKSTRVLSYQSGAAVFVWDAAAMTDGQIIRYLRRCFREGVRVDRSRPINP